MKELTVPMVMVAPMVEPVTLMVVAVARMVVVVIMEVAEEMDQVEKLFQ